MKERSNSSDIEQRVLIVMEMILSGLRQAEIFKAVSKLDWGVTERQIQNYIKKANIKILEFGEKNKEKTYIKAKSRIEFLYRKFIQVKDYKSALSTITKEIELDGLLVKCSNSDSQGQNNSHINIDGLTPEEKQQLLLIARKIGNQD